MGQLGDRCHTLPQEARYSMKDQPEFNYEEMPHLSPKGIWSKTGNYKRLTVSLFVETCKPDLIHEALWTLGHEEVYVPERDVWLPSAARTYVMALDEYDALRKIVGEVEQWEILKALPWFKPHVERWEQEWAYKQKSDMIKELKQVISNAESGNVTAARTILAMLEKRPIKQKGAKVPAVLDDDDVVSDHSRVVSLFKKKNGA